MSAKEQIKQLVNYFKREPYLKNKTDAMGEGLMLGASLADDANELSKTTDRNLKVLQQEYTENGNGSQSTAELLVARDGEEVLDDRLKRDFGTINTNLDNTIKVFREVTVNIKDFGSVYDDPTFDNMSAISAAQDYLEGIGGGQIYIPNQGNLFIKPFLNIKSGIHLLGAPERAKMKIAPDVTNFWKVFGFEEKENVAVKNIEIDTNMENRSGYDLDISPQIILSFAGTKNAELTNNKLIGNGVWIISAFASAEVGYSRGIKVRDNHIVWKAGHSTQKPDLPNGVQIDNTCIYFDAIDYKIEHNLIETADGLKNMTCIEAHGADAIVKDNLVKGFRTGIIAWSLVIAPETPVTENNIKVTDNNFIDVENGIYVGATKGFNLIGVDLSHNTILLNPKIFGRGSSRGIELQHPSSSTNTKLSKVKIIGNTISSKEDLTSYPEPDRALNFTGIEVNEGNIEKVTILENTVSDIAGTGLKIGNAANVLLKLKDSTIAHNTFIDCGKNTNIATSEFVGRSAMSIRGGGNTTLERVGLGINYIYDTRSSGTYFTRPIYTTLVDEEKQVIKTAARADWFAKRSYSPVIAFDSQIGNITTKRKGTYQFDKNICKVEFEFEVTGTSITQGYGSYITLPFDAEITENILGGRFNLIGPDNSVSGALSITTNNLKVALLQPVTTAAKFPVGTKLVGQIEYPISRVTKYEQ